MPKRCQRLLCRSYRRTEGIAWEVALEVEDTTARGWGILEREGNAVGE